MMTDVVSDRKISVASRRIVLAVILFLLACGVRFSFFAEQRGIAFAPTFNFFEPLF